MSSYRGVILSTVGTAAGYGYGAVLSEHVGWEWCFYIEGALMLPLVLLCFVATSSSGDE